ncbi:MULTISPECIES: diaminopimelate decarboxylase [Priestia]|jgi:diaminopimelate decarboxylase|uniref:diaminopimelate decarboxylase n=1 Tax=Priestia TaxID=2800373 RepID=UPI00040C908E|nr:MULTISPECIES: diaminopimelate decarboxylase [Priestia]MBM6597332.1 diaminopimelate decarboxylase [Priestia megaterium]MBW0930827.1 diaminopimelate decarboxylase [Priestia megaterium]MCR8861804.1 diaminopimelate decarboxylase [Priestia megaterium]MDH3179449.1 diaminopimelate decarboxylase [Priestia megaterium]MDR4218266.1 diaminopimelate decarboxylase [Priestia megaterium]
MFLHGTSRINKQGHLEIGGVDTVELASNFGTPLYVYDVALIRQRARGFKETFEKHGVKAQVAYASKAFSTIAMVQVVHEEGLSLDVVSGGELYTALAADFPKERIHFHGNNKSRAELEMAITEDVGCIVVDNFYEIALLQEITEQYPKKMPVLLRLTPGIEAHTHDYILTGQEDSKFGFDLQNGQADEAVRLVQNSKGLELLGIHCHIGSQIFETTGFIMATQKLFAKMKEWKQRIEFVPQVLNLGGGFGIRYTEEDQPIPVSQYVEVIIEEVKKQSKQLEVEIPEIWIEPGRSLVGDAGTTLYSIGSRKHVPNVREYVAIDGGMNDNIRPALYQAKYEAVIANRMNDESDELVSIAGKCCESGDMLMWDVHLPKANPDDLLAMFCTGAYGYSMASHYNRLPKPAVVFVEDGEAQLVVKRETYEDIVKNDVKYKVKVKK